MSDDVTIDREGVEAIDGDLLPNLAGDRERQRRSEVRKAYAEGWDAAIAEALSRLEEDATERARYRDGSPKPHDVSASWIRHATSIVAPLKGRSR